MYIFKNALRSITRNKGRNILIGIIILVISVAITISLAIQSSSNKLIDSYYEENSVIATIGVSRSSMRENMNRENLEDMKEKFNNISITLDDIEKYGDSKYVKEYYYDASINVNADDLESASNDIRGGMRRPGFEEETTTSFTLTAYSEVKAMTDFISGNYKISDGETIDEDNDNECLINHELASLNELEVGDTIKVSYEDSEYELTISGIYEDTSTSDRMAMFSNSSNTIIISMDKLLEINDSPQIQPSFVLNSIDDASKFSEEVTSEGLSEYLEVQNNVEEIESGIVSITNVKTFATTCLVIVLIIGAIVLFVINMINIRERKYEIGVLRTIGMSKLKLSMQFIVETLLVSLVSLIIGAIIGSVMSVNVSNYLLQNEIESIEASNNQIRENFKMSNGGPGDNNNPGRERTNNNGKNKTDEMFNNPTLSKVNKIDAVVDIKVLLKLLGIGILLSFVSSSVAMISIQRFRPLKILQERS